MSTSFSWAARSCNSQFPPLSCVNGCVPVTQALISLLSEEDEAALKACSAALGAVTATIAKEMQASYARCLQEAVATAREKQRRKRKPGELLVPGFCLPKALAPILPIYLQAGLYGSFSSSCILGLHSSNHVAANRLLRILGPFEGQQSVCLHF